MNLKNNRRSFLTSLGGLGFGSALFPETLPAGLTDDGATAGLTKETLRAAASVSGLDFTEAQLEKMVQEVSKRLPKLRMLRRTAIDHSVCPPLYFSPVLPGMKLERKRGSFRPSRIPKVRRPQRLEDVAFWPVTHLAALIRSRQVTSVELTQMYLHRLRRHNPKLNCAVTITDKLAREQASAADKEIAAGHYQGPLHGVPYGIKDLFAVRGYPTTWGAAPFKDRVIDMDATVVTRLRESGAVLIAKLATGELALDDRWFAGQTMNPWDLSMGSQGSSAGPGSATAAGLVGFSIGTETWGSILAPSAICGVTGLRPTFGRVPRTGGMILSWSMDKVGPMCRSVEDCALVLAAIQGPDGLDLAAVDQPFAWNAGMDVRQLRVGYLKAAFSDTRQTAQVEANDRAALEKIRSLGIDLIEVTLPDAPVVPVELILNAESVVSLRDPIEIQPAGLVRQDRVQTRTSYEFLSAADYLNANRARLLLMREMDKVMSKVDVYVLPYDYGDYTPDPVAERSTGITNLTGHPSITLPHGFDEKGHPTGLSFIGQLFGEAKMLALAKAYQDATEWHRKHPLLE